MTRKEEKPFFLESFIDRESYMSRPLTEAVSIDPENSTEIDDALNIEVISKRKKQYQVSIFIADLGLLYGMDYEVNNARDNGWTIYARDDDTDFEPMLSKDIVSKIGLTSNNDLGSPSVQINFEYNGGKRLSGDLELRKSRTITKPFSYREYDQILKGKSRDDDEKVRSRHLSNVASIINYPRRHKQTVSTRSEVMVAQFMVAANRLIAAENEKINKRAGEIVLPWLFRNHGASAFIDLRDERERQVFETINLAHYDTDSSGHEALGLTSYCHFTSPLRRFPDLANHLNVHAYLTGQEMAFTTQDMQNIAREQVALKAKRSDKVLQVIEDYNTSMASPKE